MADHLTFFRMKALPGKRQAVIDQFAKWEREHKGAAKGFLRSIVVASNEDPDELMAGVRFDSTESYSANSDRGEQGNTRARLLVGWRGAGRRERAGAGNGLHALEELLNVGCVD